MAAPIVSPPIARCVSSYDFLQEKFKWDILDHPPYSPNLAPSDFHLFLRLKKHLAGKKFDDDDEVQEEVMTCSKGRRQTSMTREYRSWFQDIGTPFFLRKKWFQDRFIT